MSAADGARLATLDDVRREIRETLDAMLRRAQLRHNVVTPETAIPAPAEVAQALYAGRSHLARLAPRPEACADCPACGHPADWHAGEGLCRNFTACFCPGLRIARSRVASREPATEAQPAAAVLPERAKPVLWRAEDGEAVYYSPSTTDEPLYAAADYDALRKAAEGLAREVEHANTLARVNEQRAQKAEAERDAEKARADEAEAKLAQQIEETLAQCQTTENVIAERNAAEAAQLQAGEMLLETHRLRCNQPEAGDVREMFRRLSEAEISSGKAVEITLDMIEGAVVARLAALRARGAEAGKVVAWLHTNADGDELIHPREVTPEQAPRKNGKVDASWKAQPLYAAPPPAGEAVGTLTLKRVPQGVAYDYSDGKPFEKNAVFDNGKLRRVLERLLGDSDSCVLRVTREPQP